MNSNKFASHAIATRLTNASTTLAATLLQISHHTTQEVKRVSQSKHRCHASQLDLKKTHCHKHIKIHTQSTNKDRLSLTNPCDTNMPQTSNTNAPCDQLATELSWQRFALEVANFQLPQLHLTYPACIWRLRWGWVTPLEFNRDFRHQKTRVPGLSCGTVCVILCLAVSAEHQLVTDRH